MSAPAGPTNQQEFQLLPDFFQALDKTPAETLGEEQGRTAISAGSDELQLAGSVSAMIKRHGAEYTRTAFGEKENPFGKSQTSNFDVCASPPEAAAGSADSLVLRVCGSSPI